VATITKYYSNGSDSRIADAKKVDPPYSPGGAKMHPPQNPSQKQKQFCCTLYILYFCLQCFDAVGWATGSASGLKKTEWWGAGMVICLQQGADLHTAQLMPLPLIVSCFSKIQIGFTFLVLAHLGSPGKRAVKRACVYVYFVCFLQ